MPQERKPYSEQLTQRDVIELMTGSDDGSNTNSSSLVQTETPESDDGSISSRDVMIVEELVYPVELTHQLLRDHQRTFFTSDYDKKIMFRKLLRSCRYWRIRPPVWLRDVSK